MKKSMLLALACLLGLALAAPPARALAPFKKAFQDKYVNKSDKEELKAAFKKAGCNTCHIRGEEKSKRNAYGDELAKLIEGDANQRIKDAGKESDAARKAMQKTILKELDKAFDEVAKLESPSKVLYADLLKEGKLPIEDTGKEGADDQEDSEDEEEE